MPCLNEIEYGFIADLFSIAILISVTTLGASIDGPYAFINVAIQ